jgi:hypothetical protein
VPGCLPAAAAAPGQWRRCCAQDAEQRSDSIQQQQQDAAHLYGLHQLDFVNWWFESRTQQLSLRMITLSSPGVRGCLPSMYTHTPTVAGRDNTCCTDSGASIMLHLFCEDCNMDVQLLHSTPGSTWLNFKIGLEVAIFSVVPLVKDTVMMDDDDADGSPCDPSWRLLLACTGGLPS